MKGEVVYFRVFDVGASADLAEIRRKVRMEFLPGRALTERAAPSYARFPEPLLVTVDRREVDTNLGRIVLDISARLYSVGSLAIVLRAPFDVASLKGLQPYGNLRIARNGREETLDEYCGRIAGRIEEDLVPYLHGPHDIRVVPEPYRAYCVTEADFSPSEIDDSHRAGIAGLLVSDPRPDDLSRAEIEDIWRTTYSYYRDDLVVVDWDAAFVLEPTGKYEDTLAVFELANVQLLEFRTYDAFLDKVVEKAYDDLDEFLARSGILKSRRDMVKELADVRMDLSELTDEVENISKFFGDWYIGRLFQGCAREFDLDSWRRVVGDKMQTLSDIYHVAQAESNNRRMLILEALIVLLFVVDLVLIFYPR